MKIAAALPAFALSAVLVAPATAQDMESAVRVQEAREARAVLAGDLPDLTRVWDEGFVVNSPNNTIGKGRDAIAALVRAGVIDYDRFERTVEHVRVEGDTAVAMGQEIVRPKRGPQAGRTLTRRYTNVYRLKGGEWRLWARHANLRTDVGQSLAPAAAKP